MIWIAFILLMGAGCAAYVGATQLDRSKQRDKRSIETFTERRNGVSRLCLSMLLVVLGWDTQAATLLNIGQRRLVFRRAFSFAGIWCFYFYRGTIIYSSLRF